MNQKLKAALASYARSVLAAASALYLAGVTEPVDLAKALIAGLLPVALRALNKKDPAFGLIEKLAQPHLAKLSDGEAVISKEYVEKNKAAIEKLVSEAQKASKASAVKSVATKAPAKKPAVKKSTPPKK
jgi:hypothetical protein